MIQVVYLTFGHNWGRTNRTVVLLMGKMHWSLMASYVTEQLLLKLLVYISRLLLNNGSIMPEQIDPGLLLTNYV